MPDLIVKYIQMSRVILFKFGNLGPVVQNKAVS